LNALITLQDIQKANANLEGVVHRTSLIHSSTFSNMAGCQIYLKPENFQKTGSYKIRGAYNKIISLTQKERECGVVAASAGNHAQGVAYGAAKAGIASKIIMPTNAPLAKVNATQSYGAEVELAGLIYDEAYQRALAVQQETGAIFVHAFDDHQVIAGQGSLAIEILTQLPETDMIFVPIGGGGLASGVAAACKGLDPRVKVVGVQAKGAASLKYSLEQGMPTMIDSVNTIADGIAVKQPGNLTYQMLETYLDDVVTVDDDEIASTILLFLERAKMVVEGAGAVSLAALLYQKYPVAGKKVISVVSGGNIDVNFMTQIIAKGLVKAGRYFRINTLMPDKPGTLSTFLKIVAENRGNVISIDLDRTYSDEPIGLTRVYAVIETDGFKHGESIIKALKKHGYLHDR
jgi:threonine dehydratase